jgi:hypothetical protein
MVLRGKRGLSERAGGNRGNFFTEARGDERDEVWFDGEW